MGRGVHEKKGNTENSTPRWGDLVKSITAKNNHNRGKEREGGEIRKGAQEGKGWGKRLGGGWGN